MELETSGSSESGSMSQNPKPTTGTAADVDVGQDWPALLPLFRRGHVDRSDDAEPRLP